MCDGHWTRLTALTRRQLQRMQSLGREVHASMGALRQQEASARESMRRDDNLRQQIDELRYNTSASALI